MNVEVFGIGGQARRSVPIFFGRESGFDFEFRAVKAAEIFVPIFRKVAQRGLVLDAAGFFLRGLELGLDGVGLGLRIVGADVVGINLPERRMLFDLL